MYKSNDIAFLKPTGLAREEQTALRCGDSISVMVSLSGRSTQEPLKLMVSSILLNNLKQWAPFTLTQLRSDTELKEKVIREVRKGGGGGKEGGSTAHYEREGVCTLCVGTGL